MRRKIIYGVLAVVCIVLLAVLITMYQCSPMTSGMRDTVLYHSIKSVQTG